MAPIMHQMSKKNSLASILGYDPSCARCSGFAPSQGRECHNPIKHENALAASELLESMQHMTRADAIECLPELATLTLCVRYHQGQRDQNVNKWSRRLASGVTVRVQNVIPEEDTGVLRTMSEELERERAKCKNLSDQVRLLQAYKGKVKAQFEDFGENIAEKIAQIEDYNENIAEKTKEINRLENKLKQRKIAHEVQQASDAVEITHLKQSLNNANSALSRVTGAITNWKSDLENSRVLLDEKTSEIDRLRKELEESNETLSEKQETSEVEIGRLNKRLEGKSMDLEEANEKIKHLTEEVKAGNESVSDLKEVHEDRIKELNKKLEDKDIALEASNQAIVRLKQDSMAEAAQIKTLTQQLTEQKRQREESTRQLSKEKRTSEIITRDLSAQQKRNQDRISSLELAIDKKSLAVQQIVKSGRAEQTLIEQRERAANITLLALRAENQQLRTRRYCDAFVAHVQLLAKQKQYERAAMDRDDLGLRMEMLVARHEMEAVEEQPNVSRSPLQKLRKGVCLTVAMQRGGRPSLSLKRLAGLAEPGSSPLAA